MVIYTLDVGATKIVVYDGVLKGARLKYYAAGLEIYVKGAVPVKRRDAVNHEAMQITLAHHISLRSLKTMGWC